MSQINVILLEDGNYQFTVSEVQYLEITNAIEQIERKRELARNCYRRKAEKQREEAKANGTQPTRKYHQRVPLQIQVV